MIDRIRASAKHRFRNLLVSYYFGGRHFYQRMIRSHARVKAWHTMKSSEPELFEYASTMLDARKAGGAFAPDYDTHNPDSSKHLDAHFLFESVIKWRPRFVLEAGAGVSTVGLAYALHKIHLETGVRGLLVSMDDNPQYLEKVVKPAFPDSLRQYVEFVGSETAFFRYTGGKNNDSVDAMCYANVPEHEYELIYIDGPPIKEHRAFLNVSPLYDITRVNRTYLFDGDCLNALLRTKREVRIILDSRIATRFALRQLLRGKYQVRYHMGASKSVLVVGPENVRQVRRRPLLMESDQGT